MGAVRAFAVAIAFVAAVLSFTAQGREFEGQGTERWRGLAAEASHRFGLPVEWVMRVIAAESAGRTELGGRPITSHAGAMGLMQIMPATWAGLRARYDLGPDPHDPRDNIVAGTAYLRAMYDRFGYPGLFGAYNAGPGRYGEYLSKGRPLPRETRDYMAKIALSTPPLTARLAVARRLPPAVRAPAIDAIFFARHAETDAVSPLGAGEIRRGVSGAVGAESTASPPSDGLFAVRRGDGVTDR